MNRHPRARAIRDLSDLTPDPHNANRGTPRGREALTQSLQAFGAGRAVLVDRDGRIIAGNKTVEQARALGLRVKVVPSDGRELIAVQRQDLDLLRDPRAKALAIADNRVGELDLAWDAAVLQQLQTEGLDLKPWWTDAELRALLQDEATDDSAANAVVEPGPTDIRVGDLYTLGRHRLLCGDATCAADVARLLGDERPVLMVTDPPYGVRYDPAWRHAAFPQQRHAVGRVPHDDRASWTAAWQLCPASVAYVWHAGLHAGTVAADLVTAGFTVRSQIVWVKPHFALSRGQYHWGHEPAWYAVRGKAPWRGDRRQSTVWAVPNLNAFGGQRDAANPVTGHSTQKPVALYETPLRNHTDAGDGLYDPFCGSGTALIAAERLGRMCLAMEIAPGYVQAAVTRWERFTGQTARCQRARRRP